VDHTVLVSLIDGARLEKTGPDRAQISTPDNPQRPPLVFGPLTPGLLEGLEALQAGVTLGLLVGKAVQTEGVNSAGRIMVILQRLGNSAMLRYSLHLNAAPFVTLEPNTHYYRSEEEKVKQDSCLVLSKFAYFRKDRGEMLLHSPLAYAKLRLHRSAALAAAYCLLQPQTPAQLAQKLPEFTEDSARAFMNFLANAGTLQECDDRGATAEDRDPALAQWAFHDLLFHAGNRLGRHVDPYGGTYPFKNLFEPLPVVKKPLSEEIVPLFKPDMERLRLRDIPFSAVLEKRLTIRNYGQPAITVDQLGEFLYRSARIKEMSEEAGVSWRPSPGGGALHELEIYPVVQACEGLAGGLYHYNPQAHHLCRLTNAPEALVQNLLTWGRMTGKLEQAPQVLLVITARFQRVQMKYQSVAYSVILKNVGCLYQTMYLTASAMGLAPCALGGGDSDLFARAAGLDYYAETSVGEFLLGSAPPIQPTPYSRPWGVE